MNGRFARLLLMGSLVLLIGGGCARISRMGTTYTGADVGMTFFVGGAGPVGTVVGTVDVPKGLRRGGYRGAIETFGWQSTVGGTLRDQMDRERNLAQAEALAQRIVTYQQAFPGRPVNIIALSAGTGIAAWAIESLPEDARIETAIFLSSSLSRQYDLTDVLRRINNALYVFVSPKDQVLRLMLPLTGSVDRQFGREWAAGLHGFLPPEGASDATRRLYKARLRHAQYQRRWEYLGYTGGHTDCTRPAFVQRVLTPLLLQQDESRRTAPEPARRDDADQQHADRHRREY